MAKNVGERLAMNNISFTDFKQEVLSDYKLAVLSREASLIGRKEVLTGKAKFGIFGDGKEVAQIAAAKAFQNGDWRSGYYRDQTFALAAGMTTAEQLFTQLYAVTDIKDEPHSGGRQMNAHFATRLLDEHGNWRNQTTTKNTAADSSPTSSQMLRALGLALASKFYRNNPELQGSNNFSVSGNEVCFVTIGDASTSEGHFWETLNAAGVLRVPLAISVWDDGYGISVPQKYQTTKESISTITAGFQQDGDGRGFDIYVVNGWDYASLIETYQRGIEKVRRTHIPALFHVKEITQPQGHSTSGSHERYKSKERLEFEKEFDCNRKMREWLVKYAIATEAELDALENEARSEVNEARKKGWEKFLTPVKNEMNELSDLLDEVAGEVSKGDEVTAAKNKMQSSLDLSRKDILSAAREVLLICRDEASPAVQRLLQWKNDYDTVSRKKYTSHLYSESRDSALLVPHVPAQYDFNPTQLNGFEILNQCFDHALQRDARVIAFGEDVGKIGDVNQGFAGLQAKYGEHRVFDVGIREASIMGQGLGMAMRGLRPIAEIQYLDYLLFGLQSLSDDVATLHYRTAGGQKAPLIVRTRGHRLEGIWHTGSPIGMILNSIRGMHLCVPRNMVQAAGMYNTLLQSDDPALVIECLNGYRLKENLPTNLSSFTVPLGVPEIVREGDDVTIVTYGSCVRVAQEAAERLNTLGISVEIVDVQTLLPFDRHHSIVNSIKKTNRVIFLDEDVPGGASAYMLEHVLYQQDAWKWLDSKPLCLTAVANRAAYANDGNYFCKPQADDITEAVYGMMNEFDPGSFPKV